MVFIRALIVWCCTSTFKIQQSVLDTVLLVYVLYFYEKKKSFLAN